ncbi:MAG TPA: GAF and ANTAR domain-containing protein [Acidimicrobiales bacterium]|nr:GAF and ANTAR domain-containing protein [Acidimicrobiales bacterium]
MGGTNECIALAKTFGEAARALQAEDDVDATLTKLVHLAVQTLDACQHAGIWLIERRRITSGPRTDDIPATMDDLQTELGEGPCFDAVNEQETFHTGRLSEDGRWPHFARRAHAETGVESILSLRLFVEEDTLGALNLYSKKPDAFGGDDIAIASVFAAHGAVAMANARREGSLQQAFDSRVVIEQAKGMLAGELQLSVDDAFRLLRDHARSNNALIHSVARDVVESRLELSPRSA